MAQPPIGRRQKSGAASQGSMSVSVDGRRSGISAVESAMSVSGRFTAGRSTGLPRQRQEGKGACQKRCRLAGQPGGCGGIDADLRGSPPACAWRLGVGPHQKAPGASPGAPTPGRIKPGKEFTVNGRGGDRTRTELSLHGILSPVRLPVSPLGRRADRIPVILPAAKRGLQSALFHTSPSFPALSSGTHKQWA
jgi:hypothetical protein